MGRGQELYKQAKKIIPGGTQLLSKRPEQYLPEQWPAYYSRAKGCRVWDMDGTEYTDMSYMGIGANVLGYAFDPVDSAVIRSIADGNMSTLNAPEEVFLAQKLIGLHPWAGMVRYAKAGGEGVALAVRIARAFTGRDKILFCGYHGWHDWYLAANLQGKDSLSPHLLSGLSPAGVPKGLRGTVIPFHYNNLQEFTQKAGRNKGKIAAVVMEPIRNDYPKDGFLEFIREYTEKNGIVLIYDEVSSGFRLCCGGSHLKLGVDPDMAVFAKGMSNGYPISAIIGKNDVMSAAQDSFISSTFYTERTGFAGALAAIDFYQEHRVEDHLSHVGKTVQEGWAAAGRKHGLPISVGGIYPLSHFGFEAGDPLVNKTYFTQEMLKKGFLATTALYASWSHGDGDIAAYLDAVDEVFFRLSRLDDVKSALEGPVCQSGFQRLN